MTTTLFKLAEIAGGEIIGDGETTVEAITLDSRRAEAEYLFAALPGTRSHGATFAAATSAHSVLTVASGVIILHCVSAEASLDRPIILVDHVRALLGEISA